MSKIAKKQDRNVAIEGVASSIEISWTGMPTCNRVAHQSIYVI